MWHAGDASSVAAGTMRLNLTAADGGPAGALVVTCKAGAELNKYMTEILDVTGRCAGGGPEARRPADATRTRHE